MEDEDGDTGLADQHGENEERREIKRSREDNAAGSPWHRFRLSLCARLRTRKQGMGRGEEDRTPNHRLALERSAMTLCLKLAPLEMGNENGESQQRRKRKLKKKSTRTRYPSGLTGLQEKVAGPITNKTPRGGEKKRKA